MDSKKLIVVAACSVIVLHCTASDDVVATKPPESTESSSDVSGAALRSQSFEQFDQDMRGGWRILAAEKDYVGAGNLIDAYLDASDQLQGWQRVLLNFHAGQMYAYAGDKDLALLRFGKSTESDDVGPGWAPYVDATIAFLERDRAALDRAYAELIASPQPFGPDPNIRVVESLRAHFDWDYQRAYEATQVR